LQSVVSIIINYDFILVSVWNCVSSPAHNLIIII